MTWTHTYNGSASVGTTEYSLTSDSTVLAEQTDIGTFQVFLDLAAMTFADQYEICIKEKTRSGATQRIIYKSIITGLMSPTWVSPALMLGIGWDVTVKKLTGTDRTVLWSIREYT